MNYYLGQKIINILLDEKIHTEKEIAKRLNVSERTVCRCVKELKEIFPVSTFTGGYMHGGN